jgi:hypothetical protein
LPEGPQRLPRGYELEAGDSEIGEWQKQAEQQEGVDDQRFERDRALSIRDQTSFAAPARVHTGFGSRWRRKPDP